MISNRCDIHFAMQNIFLLSLFVNELQSTFGVFHIPFVVLSHQPLNTRMWMFHQPINDLLKSIFHVANR